MSLGGLNLNMANQKITEEKNIQNKIEELEKNVKKLNKKSRIQKWINLFLVFDGD